MELDSEDDIRAIEARPSDPTISIVAKVGPSKPAMPPTTPMDTKTTAQPSP